MGLIRPSTKVWNLRNTKCGELKKSAKGINKSAAHVKKIEKKTVITK
jgi:hypothetical protein